MEGNTISDGSNGGERKKREGNGIEAIPTPPLSNPSAMEVSQGMELTSLMLRLFIT